MDQVFILIISSITTYISLVFIFNSRDEIMRNESESEVPNFASIDTEDIGDLINLTLFYAQSTPKESVQY